MLEVLAMAPTSTTSSMVRILSIISSVTFPVSSKGVPSGIVTVTVISVLSISGMKAVPLDIDAMALITSNISTAANTSGFTFKDAFSTFSYNPINAVKNLSSFCSFVFVSILEAIAGTTVRAIIRLASRE